MHKTTLYIEDDIALALRHQAEIDGQSQAEHIREALRRYVRQLRESEAAQALPPGTGGYRSGRTDVSTRAETLLRGAARKAK
jgi:hypothetical protein